MGGREPTCAGWRLAWLGIPLQGVIGGITVLTQLNPYVVGLHLLLSMVLIALAVWLVRKTWHLAPARVSGLSVAVTRVTFVLMWLAIWLGTLVTSSGPHAGDENARGTASTLRCSPACTSVVYATVAASVVCLAAPQQGGDPATAGRDHAGGNRHGPVPAGTADLAGGCSTCSAPRWPLRRPPTWCSVSGAEARSAHDKDTEMSTMIMHTPDRSNSR